MGKTILITGLAGRSGKNLLKEMETTGIKDYKCKVLIRKSSNSSLIDKSPLPLEKITGDLEDISFLQKSMESVDEVLHIAGIQLSLKIVKAALHNNVRRLILVHTSGIYSKYKAAGEEYRRIENEIYDLIKDKGISLTILRPTMIYGSINDKNMIKFIKMVDKFPIFPVVSGAKFALQPVHQKDLGKACYQVWMTPETTNNKNYVISGKDSVELIDILKLISKYLGKNNKFFSVPFFIAYGGSWIVYILSLKRIDMREKVQRLVEPRDYPHEEATKDFGYDPMNFSEGLKEEVDEYLLTK